jgi:uncharacterized protein YndB with AHSA1/START domain
MFCNDIQEKQNMTDLMISHIFDATPEQLWQAWSDADLVRQWWGPHGFTAPLAQLDFQEGGTSLVCMSSPQHGTNYSTWTYQEIVPLQRIDYVHNLTDADGNAIDPASVGMPPDFPQNQRHVVTFKPLGDGKTEVTITEYGWTEGQMMEFSRIGMEQCFEKMAAIFTTK